MPLATAAARPPGRVARARPSPRSWPARRSSAWWLTLSRIKMPTSSPPPACARCPQPPARTLPPSVCHGFWSILGRDAVDLVSPQTDVCGAALTDEVDTPAGTGVRADATAPSDQEPVPARAPRRYGVRRSALAALAVVVLVSVIVVERHTLSQSLHVLTRLNWAWFLLALASEAVSLASFGLSRRQLLRVGSRPASFSSVMAITYAANALSISVPFAGAELAMVFSYRQFRRHGVDAAATGWTLAVSAIFSTSALACLLVIGALAGSASLASAAGFLGAFVFIRAGRRGAARAALRDRPRAPAPAHRLAGRLVAQRVRRARERRRRPGRVPGPGGEPAAALAAVRRGVRAGRAELDGRLRGAGLRD